MSSGTAVASSPREIQVTGRVSPPQSRFFVGMSGLLLLIVVVGFAPTLFVRGLFNVPPIPIYLYVHGAVLTGWFVCLLVQTALIRTGRRSFHRQLGWAGAVLGLAVAVAAPMATLNVVSRIRAGGYDLDMDISAIGITGLGTSMSIGAFVSGVVWANFASILTFFILLVSAIRFRRRADIHKRLMLLASISIIGPALARISRWPGLGGEQGPFVPLVLVLLLGALVVHDFSSRRRVHPATVLGGASAVAITIAGNMIGASAFGQAIVRAMG
jgi:hypothetical protein